MKILPKMVCMVRLSVSLFLLLSVEAFGVESPPMVAPVPKIEDCPTCNRDAKKAQPLNAIALSNVKDTNRVIAVTLEPAEISITACKLTPYPNPSITLSYILKKAVGGAKFLLNIRGELANSLYPESPKKTTRLLFNQELNAAGTITLDKNHELFKSWRKCEVRPPAECEATRNSDETNSASACYQKFWGNQAVSTKNCPLEIKGTKLIGNLEQIASEEGLKFPIKVVHTSITKSENSAIAIYCGGAGSASYGSVPKKEAEKKESEAPTPEAPQLEPEPAVIPLIPPTTTNDFSSLKETLKAQPLPKPTFAPSLTIDISPGAR